jgi:hypothetical protein
MIAGLPSLTAINPVVKLLATMGMVMVCLRRTVFLEKRIVIELIKKFPAFYEIRRFISMFIRTLSRVR